MSNRKDKGVKRKNKDRHLDFLTMVTKEVRAERGSTLDFAMQMFVDDMSVALYEVLGYAGKRQKPIFERFGIINEQHNREVIKESRESKKDKLEPGAFPYTQKNREAMLEKIWGDDYTDFEDRYDGK